jgi:hypothetical protein
MPVNILNQSEIQTSYWICLEGSSTGFNSGISNKRDIRPAAAATKNDHFSVPVASASKPPINGDVSEPIPSKAVHSSTMPPALHWEKKSEAQAAYVDQQAP